LWQPEFVSKKSTPKWQKNEKIRHSKALLCKPLRGHARINQSLDHFFLNLLNFFFLFQLSQKVSDFFNLMQSILSKILFGAIVELGKIIQIPFGILESKVHENTS
jgi:hypothetical protein